MYFLLTQLLFQTENPGLEWEYTLPHENATYTPSFSWEYADWTICSVTCGGGKQLSQVQCMEKEAGLVEEKYCSNQTRPEDKFRVCNSHACPAWWWSGPWQPCSVTCGEGGTRRRSVICVRSFGPTEQMALLDSDCDHDEKPHELELCGPMPSCPLFQDWSVGPWSQVCTLDPCDFEEREVKCVAASGICDALTRPPERRQCGNITCGHWDVGEWSMCSSPCGEGAQFRRVSCVGGLACRESDEPKSVQECSGECLENLENTIPEVDMEEKGGTIPESDVEEPAASIPEVEMEEQADAIPEREVEKQANLIPEMEVENASINDSPVIVPKIPTTPIPITAAIPTSLATEDIKTTIVPPSVSTQMTTTSASVAETVVSTTNSAAKGETVLEDYETLTQNDSIDEDTQEHNISAPLSPPVTLGTVQVNVSIDISPPELIFNDSEVLDVENDNDTLESLINPTTLSAFNDDSEHYMTEKSISEENVIVNESGTEEKIDEENEPEGLMNEGESEAISNAVDGSENLIDIEENVESEAKNRMFNITNVDSENITEYSVTAISITDDEQEPLNITNKINSPIYEETSNVQEPVNVTVKESSAISNNTIDTKMHEDNTVSETLNEIVVDSKTIYNESIPNIPLKASLPVPSTPSLNETSKDTVNASKDVLDIELEERSFAEEPEEDRPDGIIEDKINMEDFEVIEVIEMPADGKIKKDKKKVLIHTGEEAVDVLHDLAEEQAMKRMTTTQEPDKLMPDYQWVIGEWTKCSVECGGGLQGRNVECFEMNTLSPVESEFCVEEKAQSLQICNEMECGEWQVGDWEECSAACDVGERQRPVWCPEDKVCPASTQPPEVEPCNLGPCAKWVEGPWSLCTKSCGGGHQLRHVKCVDVRTQEPARTCPRETKPKHKMACHGHRCPKKERGQQKRCRDHMDSKLCRRLKHMCSTNFFRIKCCRTCFKGHLLQKAKER
ncbi:Adamts12p, partial [Halocaridina rubra]